MGTSKADPEAIGETSPKTRIDVCMNCSLPGRRFVTLALVLALVGFTGCRGSSTPSPGEGDSVPVDITGSASPESGAEPSTSSSATSAPTPRADGPKTLKVPTDFATIQAAVDDAQPNDLVLISAGTWHEEVIVRTPSIVIRGVDRNTVVLDGKDEMSNGIQVSANGVAVENLTVQRYQVNGIVFTNAYDAPDPTQAKVLEGYRASYVTVANNGLYGLYAFYARGGKFDHVYGSGHPDGGIYIGQCKPCDALVTDAVMELNGIGYSGTNSSGNVFLINSVYRKNRIGMTPNSQTMETLSPQGDVVMAGNLVEENNSPDAPPAANGAFGFGIAIGGGERNVVTKNRVRNNATAGIVVTTLNEFVPSDNRVEGNELTGNGVDLAFYASKGSELNVAGNCFAGNSFVSSMPTDIETVLPCKGGIDTSVSVDASAFNRAGPEGADYRKIALPPQQEQMPDALNAKAVAASADIPKVDLTTIKVPS
jgi:Right handed beta helix region